MNYERIYNEFILDRREKQDELCLSGEYMERHHIIPRAKNGTDNFENLILLTAEDHIRAHLLLAKIHGGTMWGPIFYILGNRKKRRIPTKTEVKIAALAKREASKAYMGTNNPTADNKIYTFENINGEVVIATKWHMIKQYGINHQNLNCMLHGASLSTEGWFLPDRNTAEEVGVRDGRKNGMFNEEVYHWINYDTKKEEYSTIFDMYKKYGGSRASWTSVVTNSKEKPTMKGWHIYGREIKTRSGKGKVFEFVNSDGREFKGTQKEFLKVAGVSCSAGTRVTKYKSITKNGWRLKGVENRNFNQSKDGTARRKPKVFRFKKDGKIVYGDRNELSRFFNSTPASISAVIYSIKNGKSKSYKGWILINE